MTAPSCEVEIGRLAEVLPLRQNDERPRRRTGSARQRTA